MTLATQKLPARRCSAECPCRLWTNDEEVVPYREGDSPADEELVAAWRDEECVVCLGWWMGRVYIDPRYRSVMRSVARLYPEADLDGAANSILLTVHQTRPAMRRPLAYFTTALRRAAERDIGVHRQTRLRYVDPDLQLDIGLLDGQADPDDWRDRLQACCEQLGETSREVVRSIYWDLTPQDEVAASLGIRSESLTRRLHRIRQSIRECFETPTA